MLLTITIVFSKFLFTSCDYVIGYDTKNIYVPFYEEIRTLFSQGELPFWSHNFFLGGNILASKGYYFLGDPFAYFSVLFSSLHIEEVLLIIQILKFILCTILMWITLSEMKVRREIAWFFALLFPFSSWMLIFMGTPAFATFAAVLPLLILAIERFLNRGKFGLVALAAFLLVMDNFYLFWSISFYLILYWPCRYFLRHPFNRQSFQAFIKSTAFLILVYCLGVLIGAFMLIPTAAYMIHVPRVTETVDYTLFWESKKIYLDMFIKWISAPFYVNTTIPNLFGTQYYRTDQIALFSSSLISLIIPQIFVVFPKRERRILSAFLAINGLMLFFPFFCSMMHGFAEPSFRWTIMLVLSLILIGAQIMNRYSQIDLRLLIGTILVYAAALAVILFYKRNNLSLYSSQLKMIAFSFALFFLYGGLLFFSKKQKRLLLLLGTLVTAETTGIAKLSLDTYSNQFQQGYHYDELGIDQHYFESLPDQDEFYRIALSEAHVDLDHQLEFNYNSNMVYNFKGLYGYDSTTQYSTQTILLWSEEYYWWYKINNPVLQDILTTKYFIAASDAELPDGYYEKIEQIGNSDFFLYKNLNYRPFGFSYGQIVKTSEFYQVVSIPEKTLLYEKGIIMEDSLVEQYDLDSLKTDVPSVSMENVVYSNNHLSGTITLTDRQLVFFSIPYDRGWTIRANGEEKDILLSEGGFMSILLEPGTYQITLDFFPSGFLAGCLVSLLSITSLIGLTIFQRRKKDA